MTVEFRIYLEDSGQLANLSEWLGGNPEFTVRPVARPAEPNSQGSVWDFLSVLCAAGGPAVAAVRALQLWIEARVTVVHVEIDGRRITVRSRDAKTIMPDVIATVEALNPVPEIPPEQPTLAVPEEPDEEEPDETAR